MAFEHVSVLLNRNSRRVERQTGWGLCRRYAWRADMPMKCAEGLA